MVRVSPFPQPQHGLSNLELGMPELYFTILPGDPPAASPPLYSMLYGDTLAVSSLVKHRENDSVPHIPALSPPQHGPSYPELGLPELRLVALQ